MRLKKKAELLALGLALLLASSVLVMMTSTWPKIRTVEGVILSDGGPLEGAVVRVKGTEMFTLSDAQGTFQLERFAPAFGVSVTAWKEGYYISGTTVYPWTEHVEMELDPYVQHDNWGYAWVSSDDDPEHDESCATCKTAAKPSDPITFPANLLHATLWRGACERCHPASLPYDQWKQSTHSQSFKNPRFRSVYFGTDTSEKRQVPPGFRVDFPDRAGNCAACHAPTAALWPGGARMETVAKVDEQGVHCDFCHKIADVLIDSSTGLPPEDRPGVFGFKLLRPGPERQIFFGPYDDVDAGVDSYLALQERSEICAPCHQGSFNGTPIYESFAEWLASPYSREGETCQDCHMKPDGEVTTFVYPGKGGIKRDPETVYTHRFPGVNPDLLQNTVEMEVKAHTEGERLRVYVWITNAEAGHHVPTDHPMRNMILTVTVLDAQGQASPFLEGPTVPEWGADYAGLPGKGFAKILEDLETGEAPTIAYWKPVKITSDTRISAQATDLSTYEFSIAGSASEVHVQAKLIFRKAFKALAKRKGWEVEDFLMEEHEITIRF